MAKSNARLPRLEDVAERAGVSHQTVSRVINNHPNVSKATRERVEAAIAELGYRRNTAARSLVTRKSQTIGVLGSELSQYGPANTLLGVEQAARDAGYFVSIAALRSVSREAIFDAIRHFLDQSVDGIVVIVPHSETLLALAELKPGVPVVAVGSLGREGVSGAMVDQKRGAELAVGHLIEQGHRRIGHVAGPQDWIDAVARAEGWSAALREAGLDDSLVVEGTGAPAAATRSAGSWPPNGPQPRCSWATTRCPWVCSVPSTRQASGFPRTSPWWASMTSRSRATSPRRSPPFARILRSWAGAAWT
jgi:DNA-binding LacI/PurR family transcriptional regulator